MRRTIAVVSAGLRQPSTTRMLADRLADATRDELVHLGADPEVKSVELRDHGHDMLNALIVGYPSQNLRAALDTVTRADGLIAVTPTFTASYSGLFKLLFEVLDDDALTGKPVLIAATGGTGRHSLMLEHAMRPMFTYLRAAVARTAVFAGPEDWGSGAGGEPGLVRRIERAAEEFAREVHRRETPAAADPYEDPTPFGQLLAGG